MTSFKAHAFLLSAFQLLVGLASAKRALVIIDVQDCFLEQNTTTGGVGSLAVTASRIIPKINQIRGKDCLFDVVVRSQDFHPTGHISFASSNEVPNIGVGAIPMKCIKPTNGAMVDAACCPDPTAANLALQANLSRARASWTARSNEACTKCFDPLSGVTCFSMVQSMWPDHCLQTGDATFPPSLVKKATDIIIQKGNNMFVDAYSVFMDNTKSLKTPMDGLLKANNITELFISGIATDFCVFWSARDAIELGYSVKLVSDASAGIGIPTTGNQNTITDAEAAMRSVGVTFVTTDDVLAMQCPAVHTVSGAKKHPFDLWTWLFFALPLVIARP